jgi:hypothetical protein
VRIGGKEGNKLISEFSQRDFMQEICDEMQCRRPSIDRLQFLEEMRNNKIDAQFSPYRKTNYFSGLTGFLIGLKLRKLAK